MDADASYEQWSKEADVLAQVGRALFPQETRVSVRLPADLAQAAVTAWREDGPESLPELESIEQRRARHGAGALALIGMSIESRGVRHGDDVVVELDAWFIGDAFSAADEAGLLGDGRRSDAPPSRPAE
jgi:hypothetical protein